MTEKDHLDAPTGVDDDTDRAQRSRRARRRTAGRSERSTVVSTSGTTLFGASPVTLSAALTKMGHPGAAALVFSTGAGEAGASASPALFPVIVTGGSHAERESLRLALHPELVRGSGPSGALEQLAQALQASLDDLATLGYPDQYWYKTAAEDFAAIHAAGPDDSGRARWLELVDSRALPIATLDRLFPRCLVVNIVRSGLRGGFALHQRAERKAGLSLSGGRYHEVRAADLESDASHLRGPILEFISARAAAQV